MKFILNADDFGISEDTVEKTIQLFKEGHLTSATIILSMPGTQKAINYALKNPNFSFGLHLNFHADTFEKPILDKKLVPSLINQEGFFNNGKVFRNNLFTGKINLDEIKIEALAHVSFLKDLGINISHFDSHGHLHKYPQISKKLSEIRDEVGIRKMRVVQNIYLDKFLIKVKRPSFWLRSYYGNVIRNKFKTTKYFFNNLNYADYSWPEKICSIRKPDTIEIGTHPGINERWRVNESINIIKLSNLINASKLHTKINWEMV